MKYLLSFGVVFGLLVGAGYLHAQPKSQAPVVKMPDDIAQGLQKPCIFPPGGWTILDCSHLAHQRSAALGAWTRVVVQCTDDTYISFGGITIEADANDGYMPDGAWLEWMTSPGSQYLSCLNKTIDADCRYIKCQ